MFVLDINFIVVNTKKLMKHCLIRPRREKRSDNILLPFGDDKDSSLVFVVVTGFLHQLVFHFD